MNRSLSGKGRLNVLTDRTPLLGALTLLPTNGSSAMRLECLKTWGRLLLATLCAVFLMAGCKQGLSEEQKKLEADRQAELCRDQAGCLTVPQPKYDGTTQRALKWNDIWFVFPKEYIYMNGLAFHWPSKRPSGQGPALPLGTDWHIHLLPRSSDLPPDPRGYARIEAAERDGRVSNRVTLRPGLDRLEYRGVDRETGKPSKHFVFTEYVATDRRDPEGRPPVLRCKLDPEHPDRAGGGGGFMWRDGILVEILIDGGNVCEDWPELFDEVMRVLELTKRV